MLTGSTTGAKHLRFTKGIDAYCRASTPAESLTTPDLSHWGVDGRDFPGLRPVFDVARGDTIDAGQIVLHDRHRPEVAFLAPVSGQIVEVVRRNPETANFKLTVRVQNAARRLQAKGRIEFSRESVRHSMLQNGLWPVLRQRPYGILADPSAIPAAIVVCATPSDALAADPLCIINGASEAFHAGVRALRLLTDGDVVITQPKGGLLVDDAVTVEGPYPAGLVGPQIHALRLGVSGKKIWWLNYQETVAIGRLMIGSEIELHRTIAINGPSLEKPKLIYAPPGAAIADLVASLEGFEPGEQNFGERYECRTGPLVGGRKDSFLGYHDLQISLHPKPNSLFGLLAKIRSMFPRDSVTARPIIPLAAHQNSFPFDIPVVPLLRAIAIGDVEKVIAMNGLDLIEEDVAVLSHICPSRQDYGDLLRRLLDDIRRNE